MKRTISIIVALAALLSPLKAQQNKDDWNLFIKALATVESSNNEKADDGHGCWGLLQLTDIFVQEVNRIYGTHYTHEDCWDGQTSIKLFNMMQDAKNPRHEFKRALDIHNPRHPESYAVKVYTEYNKLKNQRK